MHKVRNQRAETLEARHRELELLQRDRPQQGPDTFGPWPIRRRRIGVNAACPRDCCAFGRRRRELFRKPRLPDTRLPANPDDTRRCRARCRPERESVQQARVLGRTADATPVGAFRFRSGRTSPKVARRSPILRRSRPTVVCRTAMVLVQRSASTRIHPPPGLRLADHRSPPATLNARNHARAQNVREH